MEALQAILFIVTGLLLFGGLATLAGVDTRESIGDTHQIGRP
ncbi:hypothetical protein BH18CHL1_BH18CHL1_05130 [soil metagenome]